MRRFVTYLYEYDKGNKGKNCGFVRIDVREQEVQMEVHMRNCLRCGEKGIIYILVENEDQILGIEMGEIAVSNGRGEQTIQFYEDNIKESGYEFDEVIGIGIKCENGAYLASNWEDEDYEELALGSFSIVHSPMVLPETEDIRPIPSEQEFTLNNSSMSLWTELPESMPIEREEEDILSMQPQEMEKIVNLESGDIPEILSIQNEVNNMESMSQQKEKGSKPQMPWWHAQMASLLQADIVPNPQMQGRSRQKCKTVPQADCFVQTPAENVSPKICSYQKITVSDIRNLPSPNWYLCNNNFLLHGFFNYDYLIIKKEKSDNREKFYLGVPGVFEKQEKAMAMMFGFPYFESCSPEELDIQQEFEQIEKEPKEGDFGCWYLVLNI